MLDIETSGTVYVVDDDEGARRGVGRLISSYGYQVELFESAKDFLVRLPIHGEGCLILDHQMPEMTGMELLDELNADNCNVPVVFLTAHGDIPTSVKAIKKGAEDFLPKMAEEEELISVIKRAISRSSEMIDEQSRRRYARECLDALTEREREVCGYVVAGWTNGVIAQRLGISERTIKAHRKKVMEKFEVCSLADLVRQTMAAEMQLPAESSL